MIININIINYLSPVLGDISNFSLNNIIVFPSSSNIQSDVPLSPIHLSWNSWSDMANSSGKSRIYGGIHIESSNQAGLFLGNKIGDKIWENMKNL